MNIIKGLLINPLKGIWVVLIYLLTVVFVGFTIFLLVTNNQDLIIAYLTYPITGLLFSYSVYTIVIAIPKIKSSIIKSMETRDFTNRLLKDYSFRTIIFAIISFLATILFALLQGVVAIVDQSIWFGALAAYYLVLSLLRGYNLLVIYNKNGVNKSKVYLYRRNGYILILLTLVFIPALVQMVFFEKSFVKMGLMIYVFATYSFYKITLAIINLFKARKHQDYNIQSIRNINLADGLVSIMALQTALLHSFAESNINPSIFNGITGIVVCGLIIVMASVMVIKSKPKNIQGEIE